MALLDFLKKKPATLAVNYPEPNYAPAQPQPGAVPVEQVMIMRQQGLSNPQIIQNLQKNYSSQSIAEAFGQAEARSAGEPYQSAPVEEFVPQQMQVQDFTAEIESQINEKWKSLAEELKPLSAWKESVDNSLANLHSDVDAIKNEVEKIHKAVFAQIQEYGQNLSDVGAEIKAMEKVFTQIIPELTSSVQDISRAAKSLKGSEKEKVEKSKR